MSCLARLSQELLLKHARRFSSAQQTLVDACVGCISAPASKDCPLDTLLAVREQFLSLLDAEHCVLSFEILPAATTAGSCSVIEFDGRRVRQVVEKTARTSGSTAARRQAREQPTIRRSTPALVRVSTHRLKPLPDANSYRYIHDCSISDRSVDWG